MSNNNNAGLDHAAGSSENMRQRAVITEPVSPGNSSPEPEVITVTTTTTDRRLPVLPAAAAAAGGQAAHHQHAFVPPPSISSSVYGFMLGRRSRNNAATPSAAARDDADHELLSVETKMLELKVRRLERELQRMTSRVSVLEARNHRATLSANNNNGVYFSRAPLYYSSCPHNYFVGHPSSSHL